MTKASVRNYYAAFGENEWNRLSQPEGVIEFAVTTHALNKCLSEPRRILDIGGGPGRYSIWLAQHGHRVVLADLSPNLLDIAWNRILEAGVRSQIEDVVVSDACDLSRFADESFDAVLCLGPFYHLIEQADRERAAAELVRVLKPGGVALIAFMPLYTFLRRTLAIKDEQHHLGQPEFMSRLINDGVFLNDISDRFDAGYGIHPQDVAPFLEKHGLEMAELLADTGFAAPYARQIAELEESDVQAYEAVMKVIVDSANDPSILGASIHLLYVGRKAIQSK